MIVLCSRKGWRRGEPLAVDSGRRRCPNGPASTPPSTPPWRQAGLRRFGFHGLNHEHVAGGVAQSDPGTRRLISCHLGAGCSLCAVLDGRSIATTMGFTPLEGLVMASRSRSLDPGLLLYQLRQELAAAGG